MITVCIVGWYGTETLGDRAILYGIVRMLQKKENRILLKLGSLYPFYTERSIFEDRLLICSDERRVEINVFDLLDNDAMKKAIQTSDYVLMGGGPLLDTVYLKVIKRAFRFARREKRRTVLFGIGIGPLDNEYYKRIVRDILELTDVAIFRDNSSLLMARDIFSRGDYILGADPAIYAVMTIKKECDIQDTEQQIPKGRYACINLRDHPSEYYMGRGLRLEEIVSVIKLIYDVYGRVILFPMHTFFIGGDDRSFLQMIEHNVNIKDVDVMLQPMSLLDLLVLITNAEGCVGMRYHSVVLETLLNGNNLIIDYTKPRIGKIGSFIDGIEGWSFYKNRYYNYTKEESFNPSSFVKELESGHRFAGVCKYPFQDMIDYL